MTVDATRPRRLVILLVLTVPSALLTLVVRWHAAAMLDFGANDAEERIVGALRVLCIAGGGVAAALLTGAIAVLTRRGRMLLLAAFVASAVDAVAWLFIGGYAYFEQLTDPSRGEAGAIGFALGLVGALRGVWSLFKLALCAWAIHTLRRPDVRAWLSVR